MSDALPTGLAAIAQAVQDILQGAIDTNQPPLTVRWGIPEQMPDDTMLYCFHKGSHDIEKSTGNIRRVHEFPIHLLIRADTDQAAAEWAMVGLHDTIANAFYPHRMLNNTALTSAIHQLDYQGAQQVEFFRPSSGLGYYRQRWWMLEAHDSGSYQVQNQ